MRELARSTPGIYLGLGGNLDDPPAQIRRAATILDEVPGVRLLRHSSLYRTPPLDHSAQPDYWNAVVEVDSALEPTELLTAGQRIEAAFGRVRGRPWGPRTLDIDLLVYRDRRLTSDRLTIPHPGLAARAFVLYPLMELAPDLDVPGVGRVSDLVTRCGSPPLECIPFSDPATR